MNPSVVGVLIGLMIAAGVIAASIWSPHFWDESNNWWRELVFFSMSVFLVLISQYWRYHKRLRLWVSMGVLVAANAAIVFFFFDHVRRFTVGNYIAIIFCEGFVAKFFLDWSMRVGSTDRSDEQDSARRSDR
ncbi:MAG: hypothetical protein WCD49_13615 [Candidatus Acidiferrales bacterium]